MFSASPGLHFSATLFTTSQPVPPTPTNRFLAWFDMPMNYPPHLLKF
jgi:hypothetical protein